MLPTVSAERIWRSGNRSEYEKPYGWSDIGIWSKPGERPERRSTTRCILDTIIRNSWTMIQESLCHRIWWSWKYVAVLLNRYFNLFRMLRTCSRPAEMSCYPSDLCSCWMRSMILLVTLYGIKCLQSQAPSIRWACKITCTVPQAKCVRWGRVDNTTEGIIE